MTRRELLPLGALAAILAITAAWWALALWPLPADSPGWLERTRFVCFGATRDTLPSLAGWTLLIGEPIGMLGALLVIWTQDLAAGLRALGRSWSGRVVLAGGACLVVLGLTAAGARVATATAGERFDPDRGGLAIGEDVPPVNRPAAPLGLVDQRGDTITLERFRGRPLLVAFVYAHCTTVCPVIVKEATDAQRRLHAALVLVTLDPLRDTPARLPALAAAWALGPDAHVLSGAPGDVERVLNAWEIPRARNPQTGEITHAASIHVVDREGVLRWVAPGHAEAVARLVAGEREGGRAGE